MGLDGAGAESPPRGAGSPACPAWRGWRVRASTREITSTVLPRPISSASTPPRGGANSVSSVSSAESEAPSGDCCSSWRNSQ
eukprot:1708794-Pyramimonas_sp.AAC.2